MTMTKEQLAAFAAGLKQAGDALIAADDIPDKDWQSARPAMETLWQTYRALAARA